ncbi:RNA exonuclease 1 homolog [Anneissia japonica]|uniref:RNA exonuclease 1 homolog n=1 Tax=Anneissia japonica TaxID=1529436 RepID=UPI001425951B|nr:RNA exonuclease 1 homolog [Anneissia japonica]
MFTSSGYFRGVNCPFYIQGRGMCRRPYCHFRHVRSSKEISNVCLKPAENVSGNGCSYVATPLANCPKKGEASEIKDSTPSSSSTVQYKATPIQKDNSSEIKTANSSEVSYTYKATSLYGHFGSTESVSDFIVPETDVPADTSIPAELQENNPTIPEKNTKFLRRPYSLPNPEKHLDDEDNVYHSKRYSLDSLVSTDVSDSEYDPIVVKAAFNKNEYEEKDKFSSDGQFVYHATKKDTQATHKYESTPSSSDNELTYDPVKNYSASALIGKDSMAFPLIECEKSSKRAAVEDDAQIPHKKSKANEVMKLNDAQFSSDEEDAPSKVENKNEEGIKDENMETNNEEKHVQTKPKISSEELAEFYQKRIDSKTTTQKVKRAKSFSEMISEKNKDKPAKTKSEISEEKSVQQGMLSQIKTNKTGETKLETPNVKLDEFIDKLKVDKTSTKKDKLSKLHSQRTSVKNNQKKSEAIDKTIKSEKISVTKVLKKKGDSDKLQKKLIKDSPKTSKSSVLKSNKPSNDGKSESCETLDQASKRDDSKTATESKQLKVKSKDISSNSNIFDKLKSCDLKSGKQNVSKSKSSLVHENNGKFSTSEKCSQKALENGNFIDLTISSDESQKEKGDKILKHVKVVESMPVLSSKKDIYSPSSSSEETKKKHGIKQKKVSKSKPAKKDVYSLSSSSEESKLLPKIRKRKISIELFGEDSDEEIGIVKRKKMETSTIMTNNAHTAKNVIEEAINNKKYSKDKTRHQEKQTLKTCSKVSGKTTTSKALPHTPRTNKNERNITTDSDSSTDGPDIDNVDISLIDSSDIASDLTDFETDTYEECLRIFNEETQFKTEETPDIKMEISCDLVDASRTGRKRQAHVSRHGEMRPEIKRRIAVPSPAQVCHNRYLKLQKLLASKTADSLEPKPSLAQRRQAHLPSRAPQSVQSTTKKVAPTPHISTSKTSTDRSRIVDKRAVTPSSNKQSSNWVTIAGTADKTSKRLAHIPKTKASKRPLVPVEYGKHIPNVVRQRYLSIFIDELLKIGIEEQHAFEKALEEEKVACEKASSKNVYLNVCINTVKRIRTMNCRNSKGSLSVSPKKTVSHLANIGGKLAAKTSFSFEERIMADPSKLGGLALYNKLKKYMMSEQELKDNGYPRSDPDRSGKAIVYNEEKKAVRSSDPNHNICTRCGKAFLRRPNGSYITKEECVYHWGKLWKRRIAGSLECRYTCCSGDGEATGCCVAKLHVTDDKCGNFEGFMKTIAKSPLPNQSPGVFAVDCEMCYTNKGLELTRVTVIGEEMQKVYDSLVKPSNPVIDHNSRFSGITEDDMKSVTTTIRDVQAVLLSLFSAQTILLGHSLESDLLALKLIHSTVIDTAIVFPHRRGPPFKKALRTLMADCLNKIIQNNVDGHDSTEDAKSCLQLMLWKIKEDTKIKAHS